jgi:ASPIC and UnbV
MTISRSKLLPKPAWAPIPIAIAMGFLTTSAIGQGDPVFKFQSIPTATGINQLPPTIPGDPPPNPNLLYEMPWGIAGGAVAADFDGDGDIDIFVPNGEVNPINCFSGLGSQRPDLLYVNNTINSDGIPSIYTFTVHDFLLDYVEDGASMGDTKPRSRAALWIDYDGDRLLDLLIVGDAYYEKNDENCETKALSRPPSWFSPRLFRQRHDGIFEDVTNSTGLDQVDFLTDWTDQRALSPNLDPRHAGAISSGDIDGDGYPEILIGLWSGSQDPYPLIRGARLLLNTAGPNGRIFSETSGVLTNVGKNEPDDGLQMGSVWQSVFTDMDGDQDLDILAAVDGNTSYHWENTSSVQGDPRLISHSLVSNSIDQYNIAGFNMGIGVADYDNDSDTDYFITDIDFPGVANGLQHVLLRNDLTGTTGLLINTTVAAGTHDLLGWGWGNTFADFDNNGWQDLAVTNGVPGLNCSDISRLFINTNDSPNPSDPEEPGRIFSDESFANTSSAFPNTNVGSALLSFDYDRDGDLDLFETVNGNNDINGGCTTPSNLYLYENIPSGITGAGSPGDFLIVKPRAEGPNSHAIGAKVTVVVDNPGTTVGDLTMTRVITAGISLMGQEPAEAHFGLGDISSNTLIAIIVDWIGTSQPSTIISTNGADILANPIKRIGWCSYADLAAPYGVLNINDTNEFLALYTAGDPRADLAAPFGTFNNNDLVEFLSQMSAGCNLN